MGRASADFSTAGRDAPVRRWRRGARLRLRRRRSPTPTSVDPTFQEPTPSSSAASVSQQLPYLPYPDNAVVSYVAVAPLPVFRGDPGECPDAHLARFDRVCRANGAATSAAAARIFPASLDADAALWYELTSSSAEVSSPPLWHAVRAAFLDFFRPPDAADRARAELMTLRQRPGEAVNRYHLRMQGILRRCPDGGADVPDAFLKAAFVDGLLAEFQDWVVPQQPEALDEAVALALSWERAESVRAARRAAKSACVAGDRCAFCGAEGHEEPRCEVRRRMRELWRRSSSSSGRGGAMGVTKEGEEAEEGGGSMTLTRLGSAVSTRSAQCQCRKHQCWKKAAAASEVAGGGEGNDAGADK
ncbi:uncharacterized protein LOC133893224 [Phragmites australis]|uniref:uncharacterized protein LOC133893224 n=1 Tax=Phragmites australis TaxID=29695 RepID=UPI002D789100|nr:uncharacterized protein LOC133893224 [Phragmites australis]